MFYIYLFYLAFDLSIYYNLAHVRLPILRRRTPEGIDNPFNTLGCKVLLFVCRCCLRCVDWFSYWFYTFYNWGKYLPSLCCIIPSSLGKYRVVLADITRPPARRWPAHAAVSALQHIPGSKSQISPPRNLHYLPFASRFPLPHFTKFTVLFASLFRRSLVSSPDG